MSKNIVKCNFCGTSLNEGDLFCYNCGKTIDESDITNEVKEEKFCKFCGTKLEENDVFCFSCGNMIEEHLNEDNKKESVLIEEVSLSDLSSSESGKLKNTMNHSDSINKELEMESNRYFKKPTL